MSVLSAMRLCLLCTSPDAVLRNIHLLIATRAYLCQACADHMKGYGIETSTVSGEPDGGSPRAQANDSGFPESAAIN